MWEESWRQSGASESRELHSWDSEHIQHSKEALTDSLFRNVSPPPSLSTNSFPSSIFLSSFHNSLQSSQFPSAPYMPFTCVSVVAGVSECTCVLLCLMHNRVVVVCMSSDIVGLSQVSANIKSCFGGLVVTPTKSFFQLLVFSGGEL